MPLRLHTHTCKGKQIENEFFEHSESHSFFVFERRPCLCLRSVIPSLINIPFVSNSGMPLNSFPCAVKETLSMWDLSPQSGRLTLSCITRIYISSTLVDFAKVVSEVVESVYSLANKVWKLLLSPCQKSKNHYEATVCTMLNQVIYEKTDRQTKTKNQYS